MGLGSCGLKVEAGTPLEHASTPSGNGVSFSSRLSEIWASSLEIAAPH